MNNWGISKGNYKKKSKSQMEMLKMKKLDLRDEKDWTQQKNKSVNPRVCQERIIQTEI